MPVIVTTTGTYKNNKKFKIRNLMRIKFTTDYYNNQILF